jgi:SNF2 family DNA or RNA helicase
MGRMAAFLPWCTPTPCCMFLSLARSKALNSFITDPAVSVFVLSMRSAAVGLSTCP